jgi:type I restriction enzyme M protein
LRTNVPRFGKRTPLTRAHFAEFEKAFGTDPYGESVRKDQGEQGRFRCFSREAVRENGDTFDITWLSDGKQPDRMNTKSLDELASQITKKLQSALKELKALQNEAARKK